MYRIVHCCELALQKNNMKIITFSPAYSANLRTEISITESKKLQKLLSENAFTNARDSKKLNSADLKRMARKMNLTHQDLIDVESYLTPFEVL